MKIWPFKEKSLSSVPSNRGGWWPFRILEANSGDWQRNIEYRRQDVLCYHAVFACITLITSDISKLWLKMVREDSDGIWVDVPLGEYAFITRPNSYQNRIQFYESWVLSKLIRGNTYVLKERNGRGDVIGLHILHPDRVLPVVSDDGQVFYQLGQDNLAGIDPTGVTVPANEIIHDRFNCFFHPLVGLSPLFAAGLPAYMGIKALENSARLFANGSRPIGILTVPEAISAENAETLKEQWETNYGGENYGKTAILGGDVKYSPITMKAEEAQMVEQMGMTAEMVCSTFHVPPYKIGVGQTPSYNNVEALNLEYYNSALQAPIEAIELCLDEGLGITGGRGVEFDIDGLLRMDKKSQIETLGAGVDKALYAPNEARKKMNIKGVDGGDMPMLQHQMWPINVLANRTADDLNGTQPVPESDMERQLSGLSIGLRKHLKGVQHDA